MKEYSKFITPNSVKTFAKIVHRNINNDAVKFEISKNNQNQYKFIIYSKIPTEDLIVTIVSPFKVVLDTSKMKSQLCDEEENLNNLWYLYMSQICQSSYKKDYFNFWAERLQKQGISKEMLKNHLDDLEYNAVVKNALKEIEK